MPQKPKDARPSHVLKRSVILFYGVTERAHGPTTPPTDTHPRRPSACTACPGSRTANASPRRTRASRPSILASVHRLDVSHRDRSVRQPVTRRLHVTPMTMGLRWAPPWPGGWWCVKRATRGARGEARRGRARGCTPSSCGAASRRRARGSALLLCVECLRRHRVGACVRGKAVVVKGTTG